jgi:hypothetical protein
MGPLENLHVAKIPVFFSCFALISAVLALSQVTDN